MVFPKYGSSLRSLFLTIRYGIYGIVHRLWTIVYVIEAFLYRSFVTKPYNKGCMNAHRDHKNSLKTLKYFFRQMAIPDGYEIVLKKIDGEY